MEVSSENGKNEQGSLARLLDKEEEAFRSNVAMAAKWCERSNLDEAERLCVLAIRARESYKDALTRAAAAGFKVTRSIASMHEVDGATRMDADPELVVRLQKS